MILNFNQHIKESNFIKWFGNSKVVENGKPLICYHGTPNRITEFKTSNAIGTHNETDQLEGIYFTDNREAASFFAPYDDEKYVLAVYLSLQNPYIIEDYNSLKKDLNVQNNVGIVQILKEQNYDGIIMKKGFYANGGPFKLFLAFYPNQIKSINNKGSWNKNDNNIYS